MRGVPAGSASVHKTRERERERESDSLSNKSRAAQLFFFLLKVSEAWRAELPLGVEARAWRRHAVSRSAMRMQAVPG